MWHVRFESLCASPTPFAQAGSSGAVESFPFRARRSSPLTSPTAWLRASAVEPCAWHNGPMWRDFQLRASGRGMSGWYSGAD